MTVLTRTDGLTALGEAHQASALWDGYAAQPLWREALVRLTSTSGAVSIGFDLVDGLGGRYTEAAVDRWVLPLYDGDPPDEPVGARYPRQYQRDELTDALMDRVAAWNTRVATAVRDTHRAVHAALTGEDSTGHCAPGCPFCR